MPVTQTGRVIYQIEVDASTALRNLGNINRSTQRTATAVERLRDQARNAGVFLRNAFIGGGLIAGLTRLSREFIQVSDAAANLSARLGAAAGGPEAARDVLNDLFRVAQRLGAPLDELGATFQKLQAAVPTARLEQLTFSLETVVQILTTTGAGVQATNAVLLQLSQGLGTGALRGDEFRSVFENAPQFLRAWAAALGRGGESLTKLRDEQAFTTESFITLNQEIRRLAEEAIGISEPAQTVARALQRIGNAIVFLFTQQAGEGDSILTPLINGLNVLAESVIPAAELAFANLNPLIEAFSEFVNTAFGFVQELINVFSDLKSEFSETEDEFLPLVEGWEIAFKVILPSALEAFATSAVGVVRTVLNTVIALFTTSVQGFLFVFEKAEEAWLNFRRLFATGDVAQEYDRQIAAVEASTQARLDRISASWRRVADDAVRSLDRVFQVGNNLRDRALSLQFGRESGGVDENVSTRRGPSSFGFRLGDTSGAAARAAREAERARREAQREEIALAKEMQRLREEEEGSLQKAAELQRDFTQDIRERIREEEDQIQLLRASDADRERLADQLRLEAEIRKIRAQAIGEENEFLSQQLEIIARQLEGAEGEALLGAKERRRREEEAKEAAEEQAQAYERAFGDALGGVKDLFRDIFTGGLREAEDFGAKLSRILEDIIGTFVDRFLDEVFDNLAKGLAGSVTGSGGGGFGGIFGSIFGSPSGFGPADYGVAPGLVGPPQQGAGGFGGLSGLATSGLGFGIGSLLGSLFSDSSSGTALTSTLDPLSDVAAAAANVQIINNGPPLAVESSTRRSNGDYQLIVSAAVSETRSIYERDFRRGYGGFAEAVARNTSADRTV